MPAGSTAPDAAYLMAIRRSSVQAVRDIVQPDPASDRRFAAAARVSEMNLALYRNTIQPWVQAMSSPLVAHWMQAFHPLRMGFEWWSDRHPLAPVFAREARKAREERQPVADDNPFLLAQTAVSDAIVRLLDQCRDRRDAGCAMAFDAIYSSPGAQALAGQSWRDGGAVRPHPGDSPEHRAFMATERARIDTDMVQGGLAEALARALIYIFQARGESDERHFRHAWEVLRPHLQAQPDGGSRLAEFRRVVRRQALLLHHDRASALAAIPAMLAHTPAPRLREAMDLVTDMTEGREDPLSAHERACLQEVRALFGPPSAPAQLAVVKPAGKPTRAARPAASSEPAAAKPVPRRRAPRTPG